MTPHYKALDSMFRCKDFQYEVGKTYQIVGVISMCNSGFHCCKNPFDVFMYYPNKYTNRYALVLPEGEIQTDYNKTVCSKITIVREIPPDEFHRLSGNFTR